MVNQREIEYAFDVLSSAANFYLRMVYTSDKYPDKKTQMQLLDDLEHHVLIEAAKYPNLPSFKVGITSDGKDELPVCYVVLK